jgi:hypothetical protein
MKKLLLALASLLLFPFLANAQTTLQVTDTASQTWNNGTWFVQLTPPNGYTVAQLRTNGNPVPNPTQNGTLSGTGSASITLTTNTSIAPAPSTWYYTVCPNATSGCFNQAVSITTSNQAVTLTPPPPVVFPGPNALAYTDAEISGAIPGSTYYNTVSNTQRICNGPSPCTWAGSGGGGLFSSSKVIDTSAAPYNTPVGNTVPDVTFTNGQATIDCTFSNDCNFTSADNGKICFGTNLTTDVSAGSPGTATILPEGTLTVVTAQTATCSGGNSTATTVHNGVLVWGLDGAPALNTAWAACIALNGCTFRLPAAPVVIDSAGVGLTHCGGIVAGTPCILSFGFGRIVVSGWGAHTSLLIPTPNFASTNCTGGTSTSSLNIACFFGGAEVGRYQDFGVFGAGQSTLAAGFNGKSILLFQGNGSYNTYIDRVLLLSWGTRTTGMIGWEASQNSMAIIRDTFVDGGGATGCFVNEPVAVPVTMEASVCGVNLTMGLSIIEGVVQSHGGYYGFNPGGSLNCTSANSYFNSTGDYYVQTVPVVASGCTAHFSEETANQIDFVEVTGSGSLATVRDSIELANTSTAFYCNGNGSKIVSEGGNTITALGGTNYILNTISGCEFDDEGTNSYSASTGSPNVNTGSIGGSNDLRGTCTGVVTSATTVGLYGLGEMSASTCTVATVTLGQVMERTGKILGLTCTAGVAGNQATDACTIVKNGVAQPMTCSLNGATRCTDFAQTHWVSFVKGDIISIEVIAGTSTTLSGVTGDAWRGI